MGPNKGALQEIWRPRQEDFAYEKPYHRDAPLSPSQQPLEEDLKNGCDDAIDNQSQDVLFMLRGLVFDCLDGSNMTAGRSGGGHMWFLGVWTTGGGVTTSTKVESATSSSYATL